ncbi:MAG: hypothetical protein D6790_02765 [Caldilineae bacterium]|nr:MAG: hypothetical protein D6790_02765 [Caldilineae bacterium]
MRYDANNPEERLYVNLYADWDGDGSFETTLLSAPVDPEDFGGDGVYTLGEPFTDANKDGVWNPGESFTDAAGVATRSFVCEFAAPVPPPAGITQWVRLRLDYGENAGQHILRGEPFEEEPLHVPAKDRGGAVWGEVEDTPLVGGAPPIKLSIPDKAKPGEMIHYAITATGNATWDASYPGHLVDALPENVEFVDGSLQCPVGTCAYDPSTRQVTWDGNMDAASTVNVEFDVRVPEVYPLDWPPVTNRIQLFLDKVLYGEAEVTTEVLCLPVKRASVTTVQPGQTYSYTVAIPANGSVTGPVEASMTDPLPPQVQGIHQPVCSTGVCAYDQNTNQVIWSGLLQPGEQAIIEWDVVVNELPPSSCPPEIVNTAQVFDGVEQSQPTSKVTLTCAPP